MIATRSPEPIEGDGVSDHTMEWPVILTLVIACFGAILGLINTAHTFLRSRVKLKVIPQLIQILPGGAFRSDRHDVKDSTLCIEVINFSEFAVTIEYVGFQVRGEPLQLRDMAQRVLGSGDVRLPKRLEPREAVTVLAADELYMNELAHLIKHACATTACQTEFRGKSNALKIYVARAKKYHKAKTAIATYDPNTPP